MPSRKTLELKLLKSSVSSATLFEESTSGAKRCPFCLVLEC